MIDSSCGSGFMLERSHIIEGTKRPGNLDAGVIEDNLGSCSAKGLARRILMCEAERWVTVMQQFPVENLCEENYNNPLSVYGNE
ncbi:hypothetical protein LSM04_002239 [Trypanosoma melophagium]|uniref:uncharacterized protein n=1 Tax=Trypanosoma melophagium TaxID=715481 RepID=UPI00351A7B64|nr:hypothetical protein LSM04_002239 [Trypanosoma melophagium]